jgi:alkylhydroperoxidase/carboxymuconolactone decarboxylase family protein YurZ
VRRAVLGAEHVDRSLEQASPFSRPMQELVTEYCWGAVWTREGLDRRTRSLVNLGMLTVLGKSHELGAHVRGALTNGCTEQEIQEVATPGTGRSALADDTQDLMRAGGERLRRTARARRNGMSDPWQALREADPEFFARFAELADVPRRSATLEPKVKELVCLAVNAAATHMYEPGIREHAHRAIELGATREELEVLERRARSASTRRRSACRSCWGAREREAPPLDAPRGAEADFEAKRGYWHEFWTACSSSTRTSRRTSALAHRWSTACSNRR